MDGFTNLGNGIEETSEGVAQVDNAKKAEDAAKKQALIAKVQSDPTFMAKHQALSEAIEVVNSLGFGIDGNIKVSEESTKEDRKIVPTSVIVGYRIMNHGEAPIAYTTSACTLNEETGEWEEASVQKELAPGDTADLPRKYMTALCSIPEISFQLKNGFMKRGSRKGVKTVAQELEAYYFKPLDADLHVNSDSFKVNVGQEVTDETGAKKWVVLPEFEATFGVLNNSKKAGPGRGKGKGASNKLTSRDIAANYIQECLAKNSLV